MRLFKAASMDLGRVLLDRRQESSGGGDVPVRYTPIVPSSKYSPHMGAKQKAKAKKRRLREWEGGHGNGGVGDG